MKSQTGSKDISTSYRMRQNSMQIFADALLDNAKITDAFMVDAALEV